MCQLEMQVWLFCHSKGGFILICGFMTLSDLALQINKEKHVQEQWRQSFLPRDVNSTKCKERKILHSLTTQTLYRCICLHKKNQSI